MTGQSLLPALKGKKEFERKAVYAGRERHGSARYNNWGYPVRVIRTADYLYVRNFHPERWPAGDPCYLNNDGTAAAMHQAYGDIDNCPSKTYLIENREDLTVFPYFMKAVGKRPYEELYCMKTDPGCLNNLVGRKNEAEVLNKLRKELDQELLRTRDTRFENGGNEEIWETYPRHATIRKFPKQIF